MIIKCPVNHLNTLEQAYREKLVANGSIGQGYLFIKLDVANQIRKDFGKEPVSTKCCGPKYPSLATQAKNFAGAMGRVVGATVNGMPLKRGENEQKEILEICKGCPHYVAESNRCELCGCRLQWKIALETERCPAGKW